MVFSNTTTRLGLIQECEDLTGLGDAKISGDAVMLDRFTRWINSAYMLSTQAIIVCDGRWQWDDSNQTDQPIATADLVNGQRDYTVIVGSPGSTQDWLEVDRVELINNDDVKFRPASSDKRDFEGSIDYTFKVDNIPQFYDFEGGSIKLYPSPNYDKTNGLKIWFKRAPLLFTDSDTTKKPGFASTLHEYLAIHASMKYCRTKDMARARELERDGNVFLHFDENGSPKGMIPKHYIKRDNYEIPRISRNSRTLTR